MLCYHRLRAELGRKAAHQPFLKLGCQIDFRDQKKHLRPRVGAQQVGSRLQIDLGFAAAGCAVHQERPGTLADRRQRGGLARAEGAGRLGRQGIAARGAGRRQRAPQAATHLDRGEIAQARGQD